jgi:hypothetical protein
MSALLLILAWIACAGVVALCVAAFLILAPDTPEEDAHSIPNGDWPQVPSTFHHRRGDTQ